jgi:predicted ATPase
VWKLDRQARSMKQLIETIENLRESGIRFRSLTEALDTATAPVAEYQRLLEIYPSLGYEPVVLPRAGTADRAEFVLATLAR